MKGSVLIARVLPLALLPLLTGCVITAPMWEGANIRTATGPMMFGVIEPDAGDAGANDGRRLLVIRYPLHFKNDLYTTIPLDAHGCPMEPYDYAGDERRPDVIVRDLPEARRQQLREMRLALHDEKWATRLKSNPRFRSVDWTTDGTYIRDDVLGEGNDRDGACRPDVRVRIYRLDRPWAETEKAAMHMGFDVRTFPADTWVLILPYAQPRPEAHYRKAQRRAALLTPVTLAGDVLAIVLAIPLSLYGFAVGEPL